MDSVEYNGYTVFKDGRIKSNKLRSVYLKGWDDGKGYSAIKINNVSCKRHVIIAKCFLGDKPVGFTVNHKDGNKMNNHISNLEYISSSDNYNHAIKTGLKRNISNVLTAEEASDMVEFYYNTHYTMKEICSWIGFSRTVLKRLIDGEFEYTYNKTLNK